MRFIIDRIEGEVAVCEDMETRNRHEFKTSALPKAVKEGDLLIYAGNRFTIDREATQKRREYIKGLEKDIFG